MGSERLGVLRKMLERRDAKIEQLEALIAAKETLPSVPYDMVSIDPGKAVLAYAFWSHHGVRLVGGGVLDVEHVEYQPFSDLVSAMRQKATAMASSRVGLAVRAVVELMTHYPDSRRSQPADLIAVATMGAMVGALWARRLVFIRPDQWKGQVPKIVTQLRVHDALSDEERGVLDKLLQKTPKRFHHDLYDAVGIGLHHQGRYK